MILNTLVSIATAISISSTNPTTMIFKSPVEFVSIGKTGDFSFFINNNKKVIVIQPLKSLKVAEMVVVTDKNNYQFKIHIDEAQPKSYFQVEDGSINQSYVLKKKTEAFEIYEGQSSSMFKNLTDSQLIVNDEAVAKRTSVYFPKGGVLYLNSERIY